MKIEQQLPHDLAYRLRLLDVLDRVTQVSLASENMEEVMRGVLDLILEVFNADRAWFLHPCDPVAPSWKVPLERTRPEWPGLLAQGVDMPMDSVMSKIFSELLKAKGQLHDPIWPQYRFPPPTAGCRAILGQVTIDDSAAAEDRECLGIRPAPL